MAIVRKSRPDGSFTVIRNDVLRDDRLSYRARGLLGAILSNADGWRVTVGGLADQGKEGRDAVATAMRELISAGYAERVARRDDASNLMAGSDVVVYDTPDAAPPRVPDFPDLGKSGHKKEYKEKKRARAYEAQAPDRAGAREGSEHETDQDRTAGDHERDRPSPAALMSAWLLRQGSAAPYRKVRGKWESEIATLIDDGAEDWIIGQALDRCSEQNRGPGMLPYIADDIRRHPESNADLAVADEWLRYG